MTARLSMRDAINAKCKECIYDPISRGTWREQVSECTSGTCPLFPLRPLPIGQSHSNPYHPPETPEGENANAGGPLFDLHGSKNDR